MGGALATRAAMARTTTGIAHAMAVAAKISLLAASEPRRRLLKVALSCLEAILFSQPHWLLEEEGGTGKVRLRKLCRVFNSKHQGLRGICFEHAVHVAIRDGDDYLAPFVRSVIEQFCGLGGQITSVHFAPEKNNVQGSVAVTVASIGDETTLFLEKGLVGPKLKQYVQQLALALYNESERDKLPREILAAPKTDIFVLSVTDNVAAAATLKLNPSAIEAGPGLTVAMYPEDADRAEQPRFDKKLGLLRVPLPYKEFCELFGVAYNMVVTYLTEQDGQTPSWQIMPNSDHRFVCQEFERRLEKSVVDVIAELRAVVTHPAALSPIAAPL
jgi:hypothetical protein